VYFNPLRTFHRSEDMQLYYEVYGAAPGTELKTEIVVRKGGGTDIFGKGGSAISLKFEEPAQGYTSRHLRTLDLSKLKAGSYTIGVKITRPDSYTDSRTERFTVIDP
jgi:hypothetical protein